MRILWIDPIGSDAYRDATLEALEAAKRPETEVDFVSLPAGLPDHLEYHAYEALVLPEVVRAAHRAAGNHDAMVIGCFYDAGLLAAREISGGSVVVGPCQATTQLAAQLGSTFSLLVGRRKWMPRIRDNLRLYGVDHALASMRSLELGVDDFGGEPARAALEREGKRAIEEDGAEVLVVACTADVGSYRALQDELGVPVLDSVIAPFKVAELLAENALRFGWSPSRRWGSEPPPADELAAVLDARRTGPSRPER